MIDEVLRVSRSVWRKAAPESVRAAMRPLVTSLLERRVFAAAAPLEPPHMPGPLVVSGFFSESKGVSQAARLTVLGLKSAGYAPVTHDIRSSLDLGPTSGNALPAPKPGGVWLVHCNAPEAIATLSTIDKASWRGRYRIGYWACELPAVPQSWVRTSRLFHEIWAPSEFVADALRSSGVETRVVVMPHPVALERMDARADRSGFNLPADGFCVLAMGDLLSSAARKNLLGAIDIYRKAFPDPGKGTRLVVKVLSGAKEAGFTALAERFAHGRSDIIFITENLPGVSVQTLIASCDVLLSPHRSEGFGLTLAEALMLGVPPLATGWSGNIDFMRDVPELRIANTMIQVDDPFGVYTDRRLKWADPNMDDAVRKLLALADSADVRRRLAATGRRAVEAQAEVWAPSRLKAMPFGALIDAHASAS